MHRLSTIHQPCESLVQLEAERRNVLEGLVAGVDLAGAGDVGDHPVHVLQAVRLQSLDSLVHNHHGVEGALLRLPLHLGPVHHVHRVHLEAGGDVGHGGGPEHVQHGRCLIEHLGHHALGSHGVGKGQGRFSGRRGLHQTVDLRGCGHGDGLVVTRRHGARDTNGSGTDATLEDEGNAAGPFLNGPHFREMHFPHGYGN